MVVMMPVGLDAEACSMMRAMSAMSPVDGLRYSTLTLRSCSAFFSAFLMVFHHESESGAWLTNTKRSPAACATPLAATNGRARAAAKNARRMMPEDIPSSLCSTVCEIRRRAADDLAPGLLSGLRRLTFRLGEF